MHILPSTIILMPTCQCFAQVVPGSGFLLNNEMTDFDHTAMDQEGNPNANAPAGGKMPRRTALYPEERVLLGGKRPRSSMSPTIIFKNGEIFGAIGTRKEGRKTQRRPFAALFFLHSGRTM